MISVLALNCLTALQIVVKLGLGRLKTQELVVLHIWLEFTKLFFVTLFVSKFFARCFASLCFTNTITRIVAFQWHKVRSINFRNA